MRQGSSQENFDLIHQLNHRYHTECVRAERVPKQGLLMAITPFSRLWDYESLSRGYQRELG